MEMSYWILNGMENQEKSIWMEAIDREDANVRDQMDDTYIRLN